MGAARAFYLWYVLVVCLIVASKCKYTQDTYSQDKYMEEGYYQGNANDIYYDNPQNVPTFERPVHNDRHFNPTLFKPKIIETPYGIVHYQPPRQLEHQPPPLGANYVPMYQPVNSQRRSPNGPTYGHGGSFLGGYLIGRLSDRNGNYHYPKINSDYYFNDDQVYDGFNSYYRIHHYYENPEWVQNRFTILADRVMDCSAKTEDLCVPNTNPFCLTNGTILCVTPFPLTTPCGPYTNELCVYTKVACNGHPSCDPSQNFIDFYLPCISSLNYVNYRLPDISSQEYGTTVEFCVTAVAHPKALVSPIGAAFSFIKELGKWHMDELEDIHKWSAPNTRYIK